MELGVLDDRLRIQSDGTIIALQAIPIGTHLSTTKKRSILSRQTTSLHHSHLLDWFKEEREGDAILLTVLVFHEILLSTHSIWFKYLTSILNKIPPIAILWQNSLAIDWIHSTQLQRSLDASKVNSTTLASLYHDRLLPRFSFTPSRDNYDYLLPPTLATFYQAYAIVSSRAFMVDDYHSLSLVPMADLFNHHFDHHAQLESHHWVCPICGAVNLCIHDDQGEGEEQEGNEDSMIRRRKQTLQEQRIQQANDDEDDSIHIVSQVEIQAGEEVFNTYGPNLSNANLHCHYGFSLEANPNDLIILEFHDVIDSSTKEEGDDVDEALFRHILERWEESSTLEEEEDDLIDDTNCSTFTINADAKLSRALWLLLAYQSLSQISTPTFEMLQIYSKERHVDITFAITQFCQKQIAKGYQPHLTGAEILDRIENESDSELRLAMEYVANERLRWECVIAIWNEPDD